MGRQIPKRHLAVGAALHAANRVGAASGDESVLSARERFVGMSENERDVLYVSQYSAFSRLSMYAFSSLCWKHYVRCRSSSSIMRCLIEDGNRIIVCVEGGRAKYVLQHTALQL